MDNVIIRKIETRDAEQLLKLIKATAKESKFLSREPEEIDISLLEEITIITEVITNKNEEWFVAEIDGEIIGQASIDRSNLKRQQHRATIGIQILQEHWGKGIGRSLMEQLIEWAKENNVEIVELEVVATNVRAKMLYKRCGFEEIYTKPRAIKYSDNKYVDVIGMLKKI